MATDYIPSGDAEFEAWQQNFSAFLSDGANQTRLNLKPVDLTPVETPQVKWTQDYPAHLGAQNAALVASANKNTARGDYEPAIRAFVAVLQRNPNLTDADRVALQITVPTATRQAVPTPTSYPVPTIDFGQRLTHSISFRDQNTPASKAKPDGARGAQIYLVIGGPMPTSPDAFTFIATDTKAPYVYHFEMADIGKTVYYRLRWENTTGATGPWSEIVSAVVPG